MPHTTRRAALALAGAAASAPFAAAQARPVTIIVPFAPGGSTDTVSRLMAERMAAVLGQGVVVENRPGANTVIGAEAVARAQPDGNTLLMAAGTTLTVNPVIQRNLPYRVEDFAPVMLASTFPFAVIARHDGPADIAALAAAARERPGRITYGTNGPTTLTNIAMLMVLERLGVTMQDVTYRGDAQAMQDFLAGNLDLLVVAGSTAVPIFRNNQGRILGWTSEGRVASTPGVPTFAEAYPGLVAQSWFGLLAPSRTPAPAVARLNAAANEALGDARVRERLTNEAQFLQGGTPERFAAFLAEEDRRWRPVLSRMAVPGN